MGVNAQGYSVIVQCDRCKTKGTALADDKQGAWADLQKRGWTTRKQGVKVEFLCRRCA